MKILLVTPPYMHSNTPYPATPYLTAYLRQEGHAAVQADASLLLLRRLFTASSVRALASQLPARGAQPAVAFLHQHADTCADAVEPVLRFLDGRDLSLAQRIATRRFLPEGPRFAVVDEYRALFKHGLQRLFGSLGTHDQAVHLASLFLDDLMDAFAAHDPWFGIERYGAYTSASFLDFAPLAHKLTQHSLVDDAMDAIAGELWEGHRPRLVGFTVPFPGTLYGALRMAQAMKARDPHVVTVMGGGYVSTELREVAERGLFAAIDHVILDDGLAPLLRLVEQLERGSERTDLLRTRTLVAGEVRLCSAATARDVPFADWPAPCYDGLPRGDYFALAEMANPMHRLWSSQRWNKLLLAHGCYWKQCAFCDTSLDYIGRHEPGNASALVDTIESVLAQTGQSGFHFVDEAAPPALLGKLADELLRRRLTVSWWGNVRFEKAFSPALVEKLARSGCVAVTGGLEAVSDRLLKLINKGVSVAQGARATHTFTAAGILVHGYLMYGLPTQTVQETLDALERVRQLFQARCLSSAHWHRFTVSLHSPVGQHPEQFGVTLRPPPPAAFARNDVPFVDPTGVDHAALGRGLEKALYNYMHGIGLDDDVRQWFAAPVPKPQVGKREVAGLLG